MRHFALFISVPYGYGMTSYQLSHSFRLIWFHGEMPPISQQFNYENLDSNCMTFIHFPTHLLANCLFSFFIIQQQYSTSYSNKSGFSTFSDTFFWKKLNSDQNQRRNQLSTVIQMQQLTKFSNRLTGKMIKL